MSDVQSARKRTRQLVAGLAVFIAVNVLAFAGTVGLYLRNPQWVKSMLGGGSRDIIDGLDASGASPQRGGALARALSAVAGHMPRRLQSAATLYPGERLVFNDDFDKFDLSTWKHDITMYGGGNAEFQY
jgi:hypothetical protein